jgi:hypothetical protein
MSVREKEAEYKRWQTALLSRIPDQPTFEELGIKNRVFGLEARRKRLADKEKKALPKKRSKKEDGEDEEYVDDGDTEADTEEKSPGKVEKKKGGKAEGEKEEAKASSFEPRRKTISLAAVPSFYDQDLKRIRSIHADLMTTSLANYARRCVAETTNAYNAALQYSSDTYQQRLRLQSELNSLMQQQQTEISQVTNDYAYNAKVAVERAKWQKRKDEWEHQRNQKILQSMYGRQPVGTPQTQAASIDRNQIRNAVGLTLGRIVDAVILKTEQGYNDSEKFEDFVPPSASSTIVDPSTGETLEERRKRTENALRQNIATLTARFQKAEQERERAWKKMEKTKAEFDAGRRRYHGDHVAPMPPIRASSIASMPTAFTYASPDIPSYVPPIRSRPKPSGSGSQSESKYSAARVRERIRADGCVEPVGELKRDSNGLFQRPAGRTRKGMNWDALRGLWIPEDLMH